MAHDLTREELSRALPAWCCLTGFGEALSETLPASLSWLRARWDAGDVIADVLMGPLRQVAVMYLQGQPGAPAADPAALPANALVDALKISAEPVAQPVAQPVENKIA